MAREARVGVVLCRGGREAAESLDYKRLLWTAQAAGGLAGVYEVSRACQAGGAQALARLARENGLDRVLLGACPLADPSGELGRGLLQAGLDPGDTRVLDICRRPQGERGGCLVGEGSQTALCQALAGLSDLVQEEFTAHRRVKRVLVIGHGLAALASVRECLDWGLPVSLLTPTRRLAPADPLLTAEEGRALSQLAAEIEENPGVEVIRRGELLGLMGSAGDFRALLRDEEGESRSLEAGAVILAQNPPQEPNVWAELPASPRVVGLGELALLTASPPHLAKLTGTAAPRVGLAVGLGREAGPAALEAACRLGLAIIELGGQATLFTGNAKVAAGDLEALTQKARARGMLMVKFTGDLPRVRGGEGGLTVAYREEILQRDIEQELDLLALDSRVAPDEGWRRLNEALGLPLASTGLPRPPELAALPVGSKRGGVFLAGPARGTSLAAEIREEAAAAAGKALRLLDPPHPLPPAGVVQVDRKACALCLTCVRVCPQGAMERQERRPLANPLICTACGTCAALCPMDAIQIVNQEDRRYRAQIRAAAVKPNDPWAVDVPTEVLVVACSASAARAARKARLDGLAWPEEARLLEVPCAGSLDPDLVLTALLEGLDMVLVLSCHPGACRSQGGNRWSALSVEHLGGLLEEAGLERDRLTSGGTAPAMARETLDLVNRAVARARELGPNPVRKAARVREFLGRFTLDMDQSFTIIS